MHHPHPPSHTRNHSLRPHPLQAAATPIEVSTAEHPSARSQLCSAVPPPLSPPLVLQPYGSPRQHQPSRALPNLSAGMHILHHLTSCCCAQTDLRPDQRTASQTLAPPYFRATVTLAVPEACPDWQNNVKIVFTRAPAADSLSRLEVLARPHLKLGPGFRHGPALQAVDLDFPSPHTPGIVS